MALTPSNPFKIGTIAPEFSLPDVTSGHTWTLNQIKGKSGTAILFICNHCPFVIHINEKLVEIANDYQKKGISFIAISSNDEVTYPQDGPKKMKEHAIENAYPFPYLFDGSQEVAKAYDAACTPDLYLFNEDLKCVYHGQFCDSRPGNNIPVTGSELIWAMDCLLNHEVNNRPQLPSIGCNIKWK